MISFAVIGAGIISGRHLRAIDKHPNARLTAVADLDMEKAEKAAAPYGAQAFTDYIEMLDSCPVDAVIINLPHALHESCAAACAERGKHVFLEKPMSVSYRSCLRIIEVCRKNNVLLQIGHVQGYDIYNIAAREIIASGRLGKPVMVSDVRTTDYFLPNRPRWFLSKKTAGGGIWLNYGAHALDKLCSLFSCGIESITGGCTYPPEYDVDGSAQALVRMENGVTASVSICGYTPKNIHETRIYLTEGEMLLRPFESLEVCQTGSKEYESITPPAADAFFCQLDDFISGIEKGRILRCSGEYGAHILKYVEQLWD